MTKLATAATTAKSTILKIIRGELTAQEILLKVNASAQFIYAKAVLLSQNALMERITKFSCQQVFSIFLRKIEITCFFKGSIKITV